MMITRIAALLMLACASGCTIPWLEPQKHQAPPTTDPNQRVVLSGQTPTAMQGEDPSAVQQTARTTLLEDNEHLRDLLTKALTDKRELERKLMDANDDLAKLTRQVSNQKDSITSLSEQLAALQTSVEQLSGQHDRLEKERRNLAEMYAVERRQRLAFEKELLEREIAARTVTREDG